MAVGLNFWTIPVWLNPVQEYCVDALSSETELDDNDTFDRNVVLAFCELEHFNFYVRIWNITKIRNNLYQT